MSKDRLYKQIRRLSILNRLFQKACFSKAEILDELYYNYDIESCHSTLEKDIRNMRAMGAPIEYSELEKAYYYGTKEKLRKGWVQYTKVDYDFFDALKNGII